MRIGGRLWLARALAIAALCIGLTGLCGNARAADAGYPQSLHTRYEALDPKVGGNFIIWLEREKVWHGLDPRLYPSVKYVDVRHVTPSPGSPPITIVEVTNINSIIPEYYHATGIVRFKVTGMRMVSTNIP
jgi:hypothetical protein